MPVCRKQTLKKYKSRPSPPFSAQDCPGQTKTGNDGKKYVSVVVKGGVYRWTPSVGTRKLPRGAKTYETHDNGGRPFAVVDFKNRVEVYEQIFDDVTKKTAHGKQVYKTSYSEIWIGKDPLRITPGGWKPWMIGNTVLLRIGANRYVFIGEQIFEFAMEAGDAVKTYVSPVGNSDVPYPYIIGKMNTYLLLERLVISNTALNLSVDAYSQYYKGLMSKDKTAKLVTHPMKVKVLVARRF
jgi:hypothetical protein